MMLGLFQTHLERKLVQALPTQDVLQPIHHALSVSNFLLTSVYVVYFALYKANSFRSNIIMLCLRCLTLLVYVPILVYFQVFLDATIIFTVIAFRLIYVTYWSMRYKTNAFILLNTDRLAFVCGKPWYYEDKPYIVMPGGEHFITFGPDLVPFAIANDLYVALRGFKDDDVPLVRRVELINGAFIYIFAQESCVGVVNMCFSEIQLCEDI